jgi:hypothetical protein
MSKKIVLDDGKYTIVYDKNNQYPIKCLRYGEEWRDLLGDNLIFWLCTRIEELEDEIGDMNEMLDYYYDNFGNMTV